MRHLARSAGIALLCIGTVPLVAQVSNLRPVPPAFAPATIAPSAVGQVQNSRPPMRLAEKAIIDKLIALRPASEGARDQLDALAAWNRAGKSPMRVGFSRPLPEPITAKFGRSLTEASEYEPHAVRAISESRSTVWATKITVAQAYALRLHLAKVHLPMGTRLWTYGPDGNSIAFGTELVSPQGDLWTPIVFGETAFLELEIPAGADGERGGFTLSEVAEIVQSLGSSGLSPLSTDSPSCLVDATCIDSSTFPAIQLARKAVAQLQYMSGGNGYICTGTLLNDRQGDSIPYLLTAHHCFATQGEASSLQAFWDYYTSSCGGASPPYPGSLPTSLGATLLNTISVSDFTLVRLNSVPQGRAFMGWDPRPSSIQAGVKLYRVSHPAPAAILYSQRYSTTIVDPFSVTCTGNGRPNFIYSAPAVGAVYGGSSGSAAMLANGQVVGQLKGACPGVTDECTQSHSVVDGAFSETYPLIVPWLESGGGTQPCAADANTLCLSGNRFRVAATYRNRSGSGSGRAVGLSDATGFFTFDNPDSVEIVVKVLNACSFTPNIWVFAGGLTNQEVTLTVTDTKTGAVRTYFNPLDTTFLTVTDTQAFSTCP